MLLSFLIALAAAPAFALTSFPQRERYLTARQGEWLVTTANAEIQPALSGHADIDLVHLPSSSCEGVITELGDNTVYPVVIHLPSNTTFWGE